MNTISPAQLSPFIERLDLTTLFIEGMYPAPPPLTLFSVDIESSSLEEIRNGLGKEELWQAGNHFLKNNQYALADAYYAHILKKDTTLQKVRALRGLASVCSGSFKKANSYLSKALLENGALYEARLWLAYIRIREKKTRGVRHQLGIIFKNGEKKEVLSRAYLLSAIQNIYDGKLEEGEADLVSSLGYKDLYHARFLLAAIGLLKGKSLYHSGSLDAAILVWVEYASYAKDAWYSVAEIATFFSSLGSDPVFKKMIIEKKKTVKIKNHPETYYQYICSVLCGMGLIPEFYESFQDLDSSALSWRQKTREFTMYPYAQYRYGLSLLYLSRVQDSYDEFLVVREKIPASKRSYFKIDRILNWLNDELTDGKGFEVSSGMVP
jgi:ribosomal protein L35